MTEISEVGSVNKPKIAVLLDENTSGDATKYEASKKYFQGVADAGGVPFGVPYLKEVVSSVVHEFDGLLTVGGRFAYPPEWYVGQEVAKTPESDRFEIEKEIVENYLRLDKPVLGICAGMQMLGCLHGCTMTPELKTTFPNAGEHDQKGVLHSIEISKGTRLAACTGEHSMMVNSFHREAFVDLSSDVIVSARAEDGIVEAIELPAYSFAIGLQWHQEHFVGTDHPGNKLFAGLIDACGR